MAADVFISYSRKDIEKAMRLKAEIEALGISCWMDIKGAKNGVASGDVYEEAIMNAIKAAKVVLFFLSNNSMTSKNTKSEVNYAVNEEKRMVPVNIDGCKPKDWFEFKYGDRDIVDINNKDQKGKLFNDLKIWVFGDRQTKSQSRNEVPEEQITTHSHTIEVNLQDSSKDEQISKFPVQSEPEDGSIKKFSVNGASFNMVYVKGGTFMMGATSELYSVPLGHKKEHQVTLSSYRIGQTLVTQELWLAVMGNNPSWFNGLREVCSNPKRTNDYGVNLQRPVESVSYEDCLLFINRLNKLTGEVFRLPTEEEWEFAARGGGKSMDYVFAGSDNIDDVAWYCFNSSEMTHPVAAKAPNELGIYDMTGNVNEICQITEGNRMFCRGGSFDPSLLSSNILAVDYNYPVWSSEYSIIDKSKSKGLRLAL